MMMTTQEIDAVVLPDDLQNEIDEYLGRDIRPPQGSQDKPKLSPEDKATLLVLSGILVDKRTEAIEGRRESGIEDVWEKCEDAHDAIDDMNRTAVKGARWNKPLSIDGPVTQEVEKVDPKKQIKSTVFVPVSRRYTQAGWAKACEILIPTDDKTFTLDPQPVPDLIKAKDDLRQLQKSDGTLLERDATPAEVAADQANKPLPLAPQVPPALAPQGTSQPPDAQLAPASGGAPAEPLPPGKPALVKDLAEEKMSEAEGSAKEAAQIIWDWQVEGRHTKQVRTALYDCSKLGTGILRAPFSKLTRSIASMEGEPETQEDGTQVKRRTLKVLEKVVPASKRVNLWHFFPDASCGDDIQNGEFCWERDFITERTLKDLQFEEGYITEFIDQVIREGPGKTKLQDAKYLELGLHDKRYEIWYFEGFLRREDIIALNPKLEKELKPSEKTAMMQVTMVNDVVIRGVRAPLESGKFSYNVANWSSRTDHWAGVGVVEQGFMPQRLITAATRAWIDNAALSAGPMIVVDSVAVEPSDGHWVITPLKIWKASGEAEDHDVAKAFQQVQFENVGQALEALVMYGFKLYEECVNIPLLTQGQSGSSTPETLGQSQMQDSNANQMLRSVAENIDDGWTEPMTIGYYEWLLLDPNVPDSAKQDFKINARGSSALAERYIQVQVIAGLLQLKNDPSYMLDPKKCMEEHLRGNKLVPGRFMFSADKQAQIESTPPPKDIRLQIEEIRAQLKALQIQKDTDRDTVYVKAETDRSQKEGEIQLELMDRKMKLEMIKYANERQMSISQVNAELAQTVMKLQTQRQLAAQDKAAEVLTPPTEPKGKAPAGQSFEK